MTDLSGRGPKFWLVIAPGLAIGYLGKLTHLALVERVGVWLADLGLGITRPPINPK